MSEKKAKRPLSAHAIDVLHRVMWKPEPAQEFNSGVVRRLMEDGLVDCVPMPSPYKTRKGTVDYLKITDEGRSFIEAQSKEKSTA